MTETQLSEKLIVNCLPLTESEREEFLRASGDVRQVFLADPALRGTMLWQADVPRDMRGHVTAVIGNIEPDTLPDFVNLEWLQTWSAGVDRYLKAGTFPPDATITSASGAYGQTVAEHMFAMLWALMKNLPGYLDQQRRHEWKDLGRAATLDGANVVILGTGDLGSHFAHLVKSCGAHTLGVRRNPNKPADGIDSMYGFDALDVLFTKADVVACFLPSSPETRHLVNRNRLELLRDGAILLNGGRGDIIDEQALMTQIGRLRGVGLDVTEQEPLPDDSPLWDVPNCLITPHVAGGYHLEATERRILDIARENVRRYAAGEPLNNIIRH
ncbi:D-2-hydroxyacid dehydrogenase [Bifidobacterium simiarum]|uniref:Hydroxyacid dehydrogenase n=1 Tax=Bifidobacterium simiarum TaxID=2045441 RepID=A0A2M9HHK0_9BIFI|nr:D-2-hydroxyacid dehydrogenase [Bifidobacterium simiarum]PJM76267.1 hydroxyacid dehydrogenase [Bifidobacterium simiarum]